MSGNSAVKASSCRICGSANIKELAVYAPYAGHSFLVYDCSRCGCRFVNRRSDMFDEMHSQSGSPYDEHEARAERAVHLLKMLGPEALRRELVRTPKNAFVIETIEARKDLVRLLEIGCSKGYLTAYFIARGLSVIGVDSSRRAVEDARRRFGDHFLVAGSGELERLAPFDAIYHVGTIGCVDSPIEMTRWLLSLLRPGGVLVFNAPNVKACVQSGRLWVSTAPPDLITIFPPNFWCDHFAEWADVQIDVQYEKGIRALKQCIRKVIGNGHKNVRSHRELIGHNCAVARKHSASRFKSLLRSSANLLPWHWFLPRVATEGGVHVLMKKR